MRKQAKWLVWLTLIFSLLGVIEYPLAAEASSPSDFITGGTNAIQRSGNGVEAVFSAGDRSRFDFYRSHIKRMDSSASNRLYKVSDKGLEYWTPVRPYSKRSRGVSNSEFIFENFHTAQLYSRGSGSSFLGDLWMADADITRNFKTAKMASGSEGLRGLTRKRMSKLGDAVVRSDEVNKGGHFKGQTGSWRFLGYADDGSSMMNAFFPADYTSTDIKKLRWDNYSDYGNKYFSISQYNTARHRSAKRNIISRLLEQDPYMKFHTVDEWMDILALQTQPAVNPKTGNRDGNYGGAVLSAYHSNGSFYRSFVLTNDEKLGV